MKSRAKLFPHSRMLFPVAMMCSFVALATPGHAAPLNLTSENADSGFTRVAMQPIDLLALRRNGANPQVTCDTADSKKVCDVRNAAARRALEVVTEEKSTSVSAPDAAAAPLLLIPIGQVPAQTLSHDATQVPALIQVRAIACDPALSTEECAKLEKRIPSTPSGPLPPTAAPPPTPPSVTPPATVPEASAPPSAVDPVPVTPPSVLPAPPTGDDDLVKRPPKTDSQMPVIKPKAAPPVNPQP